MFERRLKVVLALPIICGVVIFGRLYHLQVTKGDEYALLADAALVATAQNLPPLRGRILDRFGRVLISDEPAHDATVHYGVLSMDRSYLLRLVDHIRKKEAAWGQATVAQLEEEVRRRIAELEAKS